MSEFERRVVAAVNPLRKPTVLLRPAQGAQGESTSYLGGSPPAYAGFRWPEWNGRPLGFVACIDLGRFSAIHWLPKSGRLLFFYDLEKQPWGFEPSHRGAWAVLYVPETTPVSGVAPFPSALAAKWRLPRRDVAFRVASVPPPYDLSPLAKVEYSDDELGRACNAIDALREAEYGCGPKHQVGGYPDPVQNAEMDQECQLASHGVRLSEYGDTLPPRVEALMASATDWRLLLQIDSDRDLKVMWGDCGMIYFWIREQDARKLDFTGAWLILQCS
jgi:uncharacterized protein YwqG